MNLKLFLEAITKYSLGVLLVSLLIFIPAGTINYFNGWLLIGILFIPIFIMGIILMIKDPNLLKSRLDFKEKEINQKHIILFSGIMFILGFVIAGLNYRFNWLILPNIIAIIGTVIFMISYILYALILKENKYLSRTIKVVKEQKVIDKGLYSIVRHPMYTVTIFLFLSIPLVLGSIISFIIFLLYPVIIVRRITNEEDLLEKELIGYKEYKKKVKYKLIPFIW